MVVINHMNLLIMWVFTFINNSLELIWLFSTEKISLSSSNKTIASLYRKNSQLLNFNLTNISNNITVNNVFEFSIVKKT